MKFRSLLATATDAALGIAVGLGIALAIASGCQTPGSNPLSGVSVSATYDPQTDAVGGGLTFTFRDASGATRTGAVRGTSRMQTRPLSEILALAQAIYTASLLPADRLDTVRNLRLAQAAGIAYTLHPDEVAALADLLTGFVNLKVAGF